MFGGKPIYIVNFTNCMESYKLNSSMIKSSYGRKRPYKKPNPDKYFTMTICVYNIDILISTTKLYFIEFL